jgi:hypothetical protein
MNINLQHLGTNVDINLSDISGYVTMANITPFTPSEDLSRFLKSAKDPVLVLLDLAQLRNPDVFLKPLKRLL